MLLRITKHINESTIETYKFIFMGLLRWSRGVNPAIKWNKTLACVFHVRVWNRFMCMLRNHCAPSEGVFAHPPPTKLFVRTGWKRQELRPEYMPSSPWSWSMEEMVSTIRASVCFQNWNWSWCPCSSSNVPQCSLFFYSPTS